MRTAFVVTVLALTALGNCARILSPARPPWPTRRLGRHAAERQPPPWRVADRASRTQRLQAWFRWWRTCPRPPVQFRDWNPRLGFLFLPGFGGSVACLGGLVQLAGGDGWSRGYGLVALLVGAASVTLVVLYLLRPEDPDLAEAD